MKAVLRLVWSYFTGAPLLRALTFGGLALMAVDFYFMLTQPQSGEKLWVAQIGVILFFAGSSLMPVMFGRLASSHSMGVLPGGRFKLLLSAFTTILLVALPFGILSPAGMISGNGGIPELMKDPRAREYILVVAALMTSLAILFAGWMYLAMWFVTTQRNMAGLFKGLLVIMLVMFAPAREIQDFTVSLSWNLVQIAIIWFVFGAGFLLWPRFRAARARRNRERYTGLARVFAGRTAGREFDVLLGTSNPWLLIGALALPLFLMTHFVREVPSVWLYFLTIFSVVTGAFSGQAAERSRALWLRGDWSRAALFSVVERSIWRHNGHVLGALLLVIIGIGLGAGFPPVLLGAGLPLIVLGTVLSTYLGLMITRGLGWLEIIAAISVMLLLMALAVLVAREPLDLATVIALEAGLGGLAIVLRVVARRRWTQIDWMMCKPQRALAARGA
jgi:hypothetical protein